MQMDPSSDESYLHITPLPGNMRFYDGNQDGYLTLKEFARTLGHNPRAKHVRGAFNAVDRNSKLIPLEASSESRIDHLPALLVHIHPSVSMPCKQVFFVSQK